MAAPARSLDSGRLLHLVVVTSLCIQASPLVASESAVSTQGPATAQAYALAKDAGLFGRFTHHGSALDGDFVDATIAPDGGLLDVRHQGQRLLERFDVPLAATNVTLEGPLAILSDGRSRLEMHDNRYAWLRFDGVADEARLVFAPGSELVAVSNGLTATQGNTTIHVHYDGEGLNNLTMEGATARIRPQEGVLNLTLSRAQGIHHPGLVSGAWTLLAAHEDSFVADTLQPRMLGHQAVRIAPDHLRLWFDGRRSSESLHAAHRIETVGVFSTPPHLFLQDAAGHLFGRANATMVFSDQGPSALANVTVDGTVTIVHVRQPFGLSGIVDAHHDGVPPRIVEVRFANTTGTWSPTRTPPHLIVRADEPISASVLFDDGIRGHVVRQSAYANEIRFDLGDLAPETRYRWDLTAHDRAGNVARANGTLTTPPHAAALIPQVTLHEPVDGAALPPGQPVTVRATVTDGNGRPLPPAHVAVAFDQSNRTGLAQWNGTELIVPLGLIEDGPHSVTIRAVGALDDQVTTETVRFTVGAPAATPLSSPAVLVALLVGFLWWRRPHPTARADLSSRHRGTRGDPRG